MKLILKILHRWKKMIVCGNGAMYFHFTDRESPHSNVVRRNFIFVILPELQVEYSKWTFTNEDMTILFIYLFIFISLCYGWVWCRNIKKYLNWLHFSFFLLLYPQLTAHSENKSKKLWENLYCVRCVFLYPYAQIFFM